MQIDVGAHIADLLYDHDTVNIPGLGSFVAQYQPASVDQIQGKMHPPSKSLTFNDNLVADDGLLTNLIREKYGLTYSEAEQSVEDYVRGIREAIERRDIVIFPRIGRLYKDYEQNIQFLPETTNFNLDSFGLPSVQFYPVAQTTRRAPAASPAPAGESPKAQPEKTGALALWLRQNRSMAAAIGVLSLAVIAAAIFFMPGRQLAPSAPKGDETAKDIPSSRLNTSPTLEEDSLEDTPVDDELSSGEEDTEESTPPPGSKTAYIAIGMFGDEANVSKLVKDLFAAGYEPFTEPVKGMTRVGVQMRFQRNSEVETALEDIRNRFDHEAFVLRRVSN